MFRQIKNKPSLEKKSISLIVACPAMKSNVNVSIIARSASCLGAEKFIITGHNRINKHISRDCDIPIKHHNSLLPVIKRYKERGYKIIGLEQTSNSNSLCDYSFSDVSTLLIVGNESKGITQDILDCLDDVIEIPLFGMPHSLNVGMATSICLFEYVKQCSI